MGEELGKEEKISAEQVKNLLKTRIEEISLEEAKADVRPFLCDLTERDLWSVDFFHHKTQRHKEKKPLSR